MSFFQDFNSSWLDTLGSKTFGADSGFSAETSPVGTPGATPLMDLRCDAYGNCCYPPDYLICEKLGPEGQMSLMDQIKVVGIKVKNYATANPVVSIGVGLAAAVILFGGKKGKR